MLIDYIDLELLPYWIVWIDWCFYAYKYEFNVFQLIGLISFCVSNNYSFKYDTKVWKHLMVGIISWVLYCLTEQGLAVG